MKWAWAWKAPKIAEESIEKTRAKSSSLEELNKKRIEHLCEEREDNAADRECSAVSVCNDRGGKIASKKREYGELPIHHRYCDYTSQIIIMLTA